MYAGIFSLFLHTYIPRTIFCRDPTLQENYLAMRNTADVTGGKPIAV
jgi:hypothetical protein